MYSNVRTIGSDFRFTQSGRLPSVFSSFFAFRRRTNEPPTVAECCNCWLEQRRQKVKESTYVKYLSVFHNHVFPFFEKVRINALSAEYVNSFIYKLSDEDNLSPKTVRDIVTVFKSCIEDCAPAIGSAVFSGKLILPKSPKRDIRVLSKVEEQKLITYLLQDFNEYGLGILLALLTGMRIGEVCALRWRDVSLKNKTLQVRSTVQRIKNTDADSNCRTKILIDTPKSPSSVRCIPLTAFAVDLLSQNPCDEAEAFVLTADSRRFVEPRILQYHLAKCTKSCGLTDVHFHTLRHTFATRCAEVDFEIKSLSEVLGHSDPKITLERYVHPSLELKRTNMEKLSSLGY